MIWLNNIEIGVLRIFLSERACGERSYQGMLAERAPSREGCDGSALRPETLSNVFGRTSAVRLQLYYADFIGS